MRKIISVAILISLLSCSKQKYCWECTTIAVMMSGSTETSRAQTVNEVCNMTVKEMQDFQNDNSRRIKADMGSSAIVRTNCFIKR